MQAHEFNASIRSRGVESKVPDSVAEKWMRGMNAGQAAAVGCGRQGAVLVLAGAGSGKTTVLTRRVAYLLERFPEDGILALTFTKDAAREMGERLRALLGESAATVSFPTIGTFHAFAYGLIRAAFQEKPNWARLGFASCPNLQDPVRTLAWLKAEKKESALTEPLDMLEEWIESPFALQRDGEGPRRELRERFRNHLLASGSLAFEDMVALAIRLLTEYAEVRADLRDRYRSILVDEFQDTSGDQLELLGLLTGDEPSLFLVGDDDQAIYGFRGADPGNIGAAQSRYPGMRILKLETNYRSTAAIVAYANEVFRDKPEALRKRLEAGRPRGTAPVKVVAHRNGAGQAEWMIAEMQRLRREEGLAWGDMAVLFRLNVLEPYYRSMLTRLAGEDAAKEVVLSTVHAAKGLEYPAVFFAGLEDGILPYRRGREILAPERMAEERRIFYVGVTRAQRFLYLCSCRKRMLRGKAIEAEASPFLRPGRGGLAGLWHSWRGRKGKP